ncbi:MAG: hypothetical protein AAF495_02105 [Pseudomonadota bacterium]
MKRSDPRDPLVPGEITQEAIAQGIARARTLRAQAFGDVIASLNRGVGRALGKIRKPSLSPTEPNSYCSR